MGGRSRFQAVAISNRISYVSRAYVSARGLLSVQLRSRSETAHTGRSLEVVNLLSTNHLDWRARRWNKPRRWEDAVDFAEMADSATERRNPRRSHVDSRRSCGVIRQRSGVGVREERDHLTIDEKAFAGTGRIPDRRRCSTAFANIQASIISLKP